MKGDRLIEIFNGHPTVHNFGGGDWPGMEEVWDGLLSSGKRIFYASSGVSLADVTVSATTMEVRIAQKGDFKYTTQFIGQDGKVLATDRTLTPRYTLKGNETYVRAKVTDSGGAAAWVQPAFTTRFVTRAQ